MKNIKLLLVITSVLASSMLVGCVTGGHGGHGMACCQCSCKKMVKDPDHPGKCKMCGHSEADHKPKGEEKEDHSAHH